jgi:hypothetical protein
MGDKGERKLQFDTKDFTVNFQFRNTLPNPMAGPFFQKMEMLTFLPHLEYKIPSLESKYLWKPVADPFVGIKVDFPDQDSFITKDKTQQPDLMDPADQKLLFSSKKMKRNVANPLKRASSSDEKPFWLRDTTYLENNPFNRAQYSKDNDSSNLQRKKHLAALKVADAAAAENPHCQNPYSIAAIEASFIALQTTLAAMRDGSHPSCTISASTNSSSLSSSQNGGKKRKVVGIYPIVPLSSYPSSSSTVPTTTPSKAQEQEYSNLKSVELIRYDEDIHQLTVLQEEDEMRATNKKRKYQVDHALILPHRHTKQTEHTDHDPPFGSLDNNNTNNNANASNQYQCSVVAPLIKEEIDPTEEGGGREGGGEEDDENAYHWVRDYRIDPADRTTYLEDSYVMCLSKETKAVYFLPIEHRREMKKLAYEQSKPQNIQVVRTTFNDDESI